MDHNTHIYCYWSSITDQSAQSDNGIIILTKIKSENTMYGVGDPNGDQQARAITLEFNDCIILFTCNQRNGVTEDNHLSQTTWEEQLAKHLTRSKRDAARANKKFIWTGDLNVDPDNAEWIMEAPQKRAKTRTSPEACRSEDQVTYRDLIARINGMNVAEHFNKVAGTTFRDENHLMTNKGQRLDLVIAERALLEGKSTLQITAFDTMQKFGAGRQGSSDHCPLYSSLNGLSKNKSPKRPTTHHPELGILSEWMC